MRGKSPASPVQIIGDKPVEANPEFNISNFSVLSVVQTKNGFEALQRGNCDEINLPLYKGG